MPVFARCGILIAIWLAAGLQSPIGLRPVCAQHPNDRSFSPAHDLVQARRSRWLSSLDMEILPPVTAESSFVAIADNASRSESLEEAWEIALVVDQALEAKHWDALSARYSQRSAEAQRCPTFALEGSYTGRTDYQAFQLGAGSALGPTTIFPYAQTENAAFRCGVEIPLFTSGAIQHGIDAARENVHSAELEAEQSAKDLKMRVAEEYVAVLRAQRDVVVTETSARSLASHADDVVKLFKHGQVPRNDLLAAQVALSNAKQEVIRARHRLDASRAAYNRRTGRPLAAMVRIEEVPVTPTEGMLDDLTRQALHARREPARIATQIHALRHLAARFRSQNRLQVNLRGEYAYEENRFQIPDGIGSLGVGASWNVFDGGKNRYQAMALERRADGLVRVKKDLESQIALEVRRAWLDVQETGRRLTVASEAIERAEENLRVARGRYKAGTAISTEVLDAESLRAQAYRNHDHAGYDAVLAALRVHHATGQL
jgi:outer membrane protein